MAKSKVFTDATIRNLKAKSERYLVYEGRGFGIRVGITGRKTWFLDYRFGDRRRNLTLGEYVDLTPEQLAARPAESNVLTLAEAHQKADAARAQIKAGIDPGAPPQPQQDDDSEPTVARLVEIYLRDYASRNKASWRADKRFLERHVVPRWGERKVTEVRRRDVLALLDEVAATAPSCARYLLTVTKKMWNFALDREITETSPCLRVRPPVKERPRERLLTDSEIRTLWAALDKAGTPGARALQLTLLTAQRSGEVRLATWAEFDLKAAVWTIPAEHTKTGLVHRLPLSTAAVRLLTDMQQRFGDDPGSPVFPGRPPRADDAGPVELPHLDRRAPGRLMTRLLPAPRGERATPHDLRRTSATRMSAMGVPRVVLARVLNHVDRSTTSIYDRHGYIAEMRQALETWGDTLMAIVAEKPARRTRIAAGERNAAG